MECTLKVINKKKKKNTKPFFFISFPFSGENHIVFYSKYKKSFKLALNLGKRNNCFQYIKNCNLIFVC